METPVLFPSQRVAPETFVIPSYLPVPGLGVLAVNAFLIRGAEPVLVDTGLAALRDRFTNELEKLIDPAELRWIWLTHTDPDHAGSLQAVLEHAPQAKVVTTYLGMGKLSMMEPLPAQRAYLLNPGQLLDIGDRRLAAFTPPTFDAPETTGLLDTTTRALFTSDCFGAVLSHPWERAEHIPAEELGQGLVTWTTLDAPWLHAVDEGVFLQNLNSLASHEPSVILSSHLPVARGVTPALLHHLRAARAAPPFVGPDQAALSAMMAAVA